jgi:hypothetical protein
MASMLTFSGIFFLLFGAAEVQSWALPPVKTIAPTISQTTVVSMVSNDSKIPLDSNTFYVDKPLNGRERAFSRFWYIQDFFINYACNWIYGEGLIQVGFY